MAGIWAHRGASAIAPENTMPAFEMALEMGADGLELDVQRSKDGVLVVIHDETVDRVSNGTGAVVDLTYDQLSALDVSAGKDGYAGVRIPTLEEVLSLISGTDKVVNVELKNSEELYHAMESEIEALVTSMSLTAQVWYSSFNHLSLVELSSSRCPRGVLYAQQLVKVWDYAAGFGAEALHPHYGLVDAELVEQAHTRGMRVHPWTVDDPTVMVHLLELGVDAIITNVPDLARATIGSEVY